MDEALTTRNLVCERCATVIAPGAPVGHCPACLLRIAMETNADFAESEPWQSLGGYDLYEEIARGGMGIVYRARQRELGRIVALKILRGSEFADATARARFRSEAKAAAALRHPHIVAIHEFGEESGVCWFSMDWIEGADLAEHTREHPAAAREAARIVSAAAGAVHHAHIHGVLHRDVKPSNILLGTGGSVYVTDFGIARREGVDATSATRTGQALGSPSYAAPEQALDGSSSACSDVYGLGAVLYHLLTGRPPFQGPTLDSVLVQLRERDPLPPRRIVPDIPQDLENICLQCLRKSPVRRYPSAEAVQADLERFLRGEMVSARPMSPLYRAARWCRRRPGVAALLGFCLLLLLSLVIGSMVFAREKVLLERRTTLVLQARLARADSIAGSRSFAVTALREAWAIAPSAEIRDEMIATLSMPEITHEEFRAKTPPPSAASQRIEIAGRLVEIAPDRRTVRYRPDAQSDFSQEMRHPLGVAALAWNGGTLAAGCEDRLLYFWDPATGRLLHKLNGHDAVPESLLFLPHSQLLLSAGNDSMLHLWHTGRGTSLLAIEGAERHRAPMEWIDNRRLICPRTEGGADIYRVDWPDYLRVVAPGYDDPRSENIRPFALSPDGKTAAASNGEGLRVWDVHEAVPRIILPKKSPTEWFSTRIGNDGTVWACGYDTGLVRLGPGDRVFQTVATPGGCLLVALDHEARQIALSDNTRGGWWIVDVSNPLIPPRWLPQNNPLCAAFSADGTRLFTGSYSQPNVLVWRLADAALEREIPTDTPVNQLDTLSNGNQLSVTTHKTVSRVDLSTGEVLSSKPAAELRGLVFSPAGGFAACYERSSIRLLRASDLSDVARINLPSFTGHATHYALELSADGQTLGASTAFGSVVTWHLPSLYAQLRDMGMEW